ncbi:MAG: biotin--[acetyl-CoA-carboxylase] ligase [Dehalococcoidales bacterium]
MVMDVLSPELVTDGLETRFIGQRVLYFPSRSSTMVAARQEARQMAAEGTVVITGEQTAGKGRVKRVWLSPRGSIALSVVLYPDVSQLPYLIMIASVAAARSIEMVTGLETQLKWPNDVLVNGRKVCGILIENELKGSRVAWAVIGIGINVNIRMEDFPEVAAMATSLYDELGKELPRVEIIRHLLVEMEKLYLSLGKRELIYQEWRDRLVTLGQKLRVASGETVLEGVAEDVARDGSLLLKHRDGHLRRIVAGDVTLRNAG